MCSSSEAQAILKPLFDDYDKAIEAQQYDKVVAFYHPDGVLVEKGKECYHGRKAIKEMFLKFDSMAGKTVSKLHGTTYQMTPDYIIITSDYESTTEKMGVIKGKFSQIWKKENNTYLIYHDQFEML